MDAMLAAALHVLVALVWLILLRRTVRAAREATGPGPLHTADAAVVGAAAVAVRVVGACAFAATPLFDHPLVDAAYYHDWARGLAAGVDPYPVFGVDPLYAHTLGGLYLIFGAGPWVSLALGATLGTAASLLAHRLCARVASRPVALLMGVAAALHGPALAYDLLRLKSSLALCVTLALLEAFLTAAAAAPARALVPGALLGLASLNGAQALAALPVMAASLLRRRAGTLRLLCLVAPVVLAVGWTWLHNARGGDPVPLHTGSGMILWASNNPAAWGRLVALPFVRQDSRYETIDYTREASRLTGRPLRASEATAYWRARAIEFVRADPVRALELVWIKLGFLLSATEWPDNYDFRVLGGLMPHLTLPLPGWGWVMPLALLGLALALAARPPVPGARVLALSAVLFSLPFLLTYSNGRLRLPLLAAGWPLAALALDRLAREPRALRLASVAVLALAIHAPVVEPPIAAGLVGVAEGCRAAGLYDQAMELYAYALHSDPDHFVALVNLGNLALAGNRPDAAARLFQRAVIARPSSAAAWYNLGNAWRRSGRPREALAAYDRARGGEVPDALVLLKCGLARADLGQSGPARQILERALAELAIHPAGSAEERAEAEASLRSLAP